MKKKRIGVIIDSVDGIYQERIMRSIDKQTSKQDIDLYFVCSLGVVDIAGDFEVHQGVLTLANTPFLDGLIFVMGTFTNYFSHDWINQLIESYDSEVKIVLGYNSDYPDKVVFDNVSSIEKVVEHLIKDIGCKSIGYISGPLENNDALDRYEGYKMVLNDYSIEINKQFYYEGFFMEYTGNEAIMELIKKSYKIPDAIVCASDEIAIGASFELLKNGIAVPYGVKVTGFDNITASAAFEVPITTVEQPIEEMTAKALDYINHKFYGQEEVNLEPISGDLILRDSTRKVSEIESLKLGGLREESFIGENIIGSLIRFEEEMNDNVERLCQMFTRDFDLEDQVSTIFAKMIKGLTIDVKTPDSKGMFLSQIIELSTILVEKMPYSLFNMRFNEFKKQISDLVFNSQLFYRIQEVMFEAALAVNNHFYSIESALKHEVKDLYIMSRSFVNLEDKAENLEDYYNLLINNIKNHIFPEFYLCMFESPIYGDLSKKLELPNNTKLVIGVKEDKWYEQEVFDTYKIFPDCVSDDSDPKRLVIMNVVRDNVHYGYLAINLNVDETQYYETIRLTISQAIHRLVSKA